MSLIYVTTTTIAQLDTGNSAHVNLVADDGGNDVSSDDNKLWDRRHIIRSSAVEDGGRRLSSRDFRNFGRLSTDDANNNGFFTDPLWDIFIA